MEAEDAEAIAGVAASTSGDGTNSESTSTSCAPLSEANENMERSSDESDPLMSAAVKMTQKFELDRARKNFQLAKQMLKDEDFVKAVALLKIVCSDFRLLCDDDAELAEVYMTYGIALLHLHRRRNRLRTVSTAFNASMETNSGEITTKDDAVDAPPPPPAETNIVQPKKECIERDEYNSNEDSSARYRERRLGSNVSSPEDIADEEEGEGGKGGNDDPVPLIFEMFEEAKEIFVAKRDHVNCSNVFSKLGEANADVGNFQTAIEEFTFSLYILENLSATGYMRQKTVLHFQLFLTMFKAWRYREAEKELMQALAIATVYLQTLHVKLNGRAEAKHLSQEIQQVEELVKVMTRSAANLSSARGEEEETRPTYREDEVAQLLSTMSLLNKSPSSSSENVTAAPIIEIPPQLQSKPLAFKHQRILSLVESINVDLLNQFDDETMSESGENAGTSLGESEEYIRRCKRKADNGRGKPDEAESSSKKACGTSDVLPSAEASAPPQKP